MYANQPILHSIHKRWIAFASKRMYKKNDYYYISATPRVLRAVAAFGIIVNNSRARNALVTFSCRKSDCPRLGNREAKMKVYVGLLGYPFAVGTVGCVVFLFVFMARASTSGIGDISATSGMVANFLRTCFSAGRRMGLLEMDISTLLADICERHLG